MERPYHPYMKLTVRPETFSLHRLAPDADMPAGISGAVVWFAGRTEKELSIVSPTSIPVEAPVSEPDWACLSVEGPLDFGMTGVLAEPATSLASAGIPIFAVSTFDTDHILVKSDNVETAIRALTEAGHTIENHV